MSRGSHAGVVCIGGGVGCRGLVAVPVAAMIEMAGVFKSNICIPIIEDDGGVWYNAAVYVGRDGQIAGRGRLHSWPSSVVGGDCISRAAGNDS